MSGLNWGKDRNRQLRARAAREQYAADRTPDPAIPASRKKLEGTKAKFATAPKTTIRCSCGNSAEIPAVSGLTFRCQCGLRWRT